LNEEINTTGVDKLDAALDEYEKKIGLSNLKESAVTQYLNLTQEVLRKMSPEECGEAAYLLNQEALFVQHEINKHKAQMDWGNSRINRIIYSQLQNYGGKYDNHDVRRTLAIKGDSAAQELQKVVDKADRIISRLSYVPNHLSKLASVLLDYRHTKVASTREIK
jgi:hypothetical protein